MAERELYSDEQRTEVNAPVPVTPTKPVEQHTSALDAVERPSKPQIQAQVKKKNLGKRIVEAFVPEDVPDVKDYILFDLLIPTVKDFMVDMGQNLLDMVFYGEVRGRNRRRTSNGGTIRDKYTAYDKQPSRRQQSSNRSTFMDDPVVFDSRSDAQEVIDALQSIMRKEHCVTLADLYRESGIASHNRQDAYYGWTEIPSQPRNVRGDWVIPFERPYDIR